jgi:galactoside O-acetyltransferase
MIGALITRRPPLWSLTGLRHRDIHPTARVRPWQVASGRGCDLAVGADSLIGGRIAFDRPGGAVTIGARSFVGKSLLVCAERITIGDDVLMSWGVTVVDHDSHSLAWRRRQNDVLDWGQGRKDWTHVPVAPVTIQNKAWVGFDVSILKGVTIGEGAVIGAGSVVTRDVAPWTAAAGNPARKIRDLGPAA